MRWYYVQTIGRCLAKYALRGKSGLPPTSVNEVLLKHNHTSWFTHCLCNKGRVEWSQQRLNGPQNLKQSLPSPGVGDPSGGSSQSYWVIDRSRGACALASPNVNLAWATGRRLCPTLDWLSQDLHFLKIGRCFVPPSPLEKHGDNHIQVSCSDIEQAPLNLMSFILLMHLLTLAF